MKGLRIVWIAVFGVGLIVLTACGTRPNAGKPADRPASAVRQIAEIQADSRQAGKLQAGEQQPGEPQAGVKQAGGQQAQPETATKPAVNPARKGGPAPRYLDLSVAPQGETFRQGDEVKFAVTLTNVYTETLHIANAPALLVGPALAPTTEHAAIALPDLAGATLKPGESATTSAVWKQTGEPGWYSAAFGDIRLDAVTLGGADTRFFVSYPAGTLRTGKVESGAELRLPTEDGEMTFVLKQIEMGERETKIAYEFHTDLMSPMGFQIAMTPSSGGGAYNQALSVEQNGEKDGVIQGRATFAPVSRDAQSLRFTITDWQVIYKGDHTEIRKGPWTIDVPLK